MGKAPQNLSPSSIKKIQKILSNLEERIPIVTADDYGSLVNYSQASDEPIHRWFRYREGYSTKLVEKVLSDVPVGNLVVDPFCGAGTTLLAAKRLGYPSVGIDANPLSVFVARVKTRKYNVRQIERFGDLISEFRSLTPTDPAATKPALSIIDKIFSQKVLEALLVLKNHIDNHLGGRDRDFCFLAWLSVLEGVSNVYREGNGIKYRNRKRTPTGYVEIPMDAWQESRFPQDQFTHVIETFCSRMQLMIGDLTTRQSNYHEPDIFEGDALELDEYVTPNSASLVVFSPPYANNFNYFKAYKVELWMGGFVKNYGDLRQLTRRSLRSHVETQLKRDDDKNNWYPEELDELLEIIPPDSLWTDRIPRAVRGYFYDMHSVIKNIFDILKTNGRCAVVVGNSAYGSVPIPSDILLAEIAREAGFKVDRLGVARHLTTSSQQKQALEPLRRYLRESILFLTKPKHPSNLQQIKNPAHPKYRYVDELPRLPREAQQVTYVVRNRGLTELTHGIHKWPSKFIPHIPRWALGKYLGTVRDKVLLDPFCGSGTTMIEGCLAGHKSIGIDIDPLARLISKVKTTPIEASILNDAVKRVSKLIDTENEPDFVPKLETLNHWFRPSVVRDLGIIRDVIERWRCNPEIYDFLIVTMSAIIRRVSNADNQSLKTYVSGTHAKKRIATKPLFKKTLLEYSGCLLQFSEAIQNGGSAQILSGFDARDMANMWFDRNLPPVDIAITSPPYIKSIDIIYNQMAELFWIGDLFELENQAKQNAAKRYYIGTEKVSAAQYREKIATGITSADRLLEMIYDRDPKHAYIVARYFLDMKSHFRQMAQILRSGGHYVFVVGESNVSKIKIPTAKLLSEVAESEGFELIGQFVYEIRNRYMRFPRQGRGGTVDLDWVLTFRNSRS